MLRACPGSRVACRLCRPVLGCFEEIRVCCHPAGGNRTPSRDANRSGRTHLHRETARSLCIGEEYGRLEAPSSGVVSFYTDTRTASGEKFNPEELTAAHPTLPFGTKLRVTNAVTGRSVTVRVNDRGPYVYGRVVDVTHSAAQALGMVGSGIAKVKLDVVE